jgi:hypothetical protein
MFRGRPDVEEIDGGQKNFMLEEMKKLKEKVSPTFFSFDSRY